MPSYTTVILIVEKDKKLTHIRCSLFSGRSLQTSRWGCPESRNGAQWAADWLPHMWCFWLCWFVGVGCPALRFTTGRWNICCLVVDIVVPMYGYTALWSLASPSSIFRLLVGIPSSSPYEALKVGQLQRPYWVSLADNDNGEVGNIGPTSWHDELLNINTPCYKIT